MKPRILGLSASLRHARSRKGARDLLKEIAALEDIDALYRFVEEQAKIHLDQFVEAGRADGVPFDDLYRKLRGMGGTRGLSNSEICLAAALWAAQSQGAELNHIPLGDHFPADGRSRDLEALKQALRDADAVLLASPVYFGDRSSLSQRFIEMIRADHQLRRSLAGKVYAGISVGAKRNGGQETTLIYQMLDMLNLGLLAVGNDSETTSQYGGTAHAGDVGTAAKDRYGIDTSMGAGRRIARVAAQLKAASGAGLADRPKIGVWLLQDRNQEMATRLKPLLEAIEAPAELAFHDVTGQTIRPCLACDICPTHVGPDNEYRCIISKAGDGLKQLHDVLLQPDVLVPAMYSPVDRSGLKSVYQEFMERTRYLRRGDYVFTDRLVVPLVFAEVGADEHLDIRMMTSFIRHHTVLCKPVVGLIHEGTLINEKDVAAGLEQAVAEGRRLLAGRLASVSLNHASTAYNPVGYVLAQAKDHEAQTMTARDRAIRDRHRKLAEQARRRLRTAEEGLSTGTG